MASNVAWTALDILSSMPACPLHMRLKIGMLIYMQNGRRPLTLTPNVSFLPTITFVEMTWLSPDYTEPDASQAEISTSWALLILIVLLIVALFASYILQTRKIQAVHETVMSIFAGK
jgi:hypothetical protein